MVDAVSLSAVDSNTYCAVSSIVNHHHTEDSEDEEASAKTTTTDHTTKLPMPSIDL